MKLSLRRPRSPLMIALFLSFVLLVGLFMGWISCHVISDDNAFRSLTDNIFQEEVSGSMLTLHYSLAYPEKKQISRPSPSLGTISADMDISEVRTVSSETEELFRLPTESRKSDHPGYAAPLLSDTALIQRLSSSG